jgi:uncharacterized membrane protein
VLKKAIRRSHMESAALLVLAILVFIIAAPIVALVRSGRAERRVEELEERVKEMYFLIRNLQSQPTPTAAPEPPLAESEKPAEPAASATHYDQQPRITPSWVTKPAPPPTPAVTQATPAPPIQTPPPPPPPVSRPVPQPQPAQPGTNWEVIIGGNVFNRIGALAIIITMGFLLSYAYQQGWITQGMIVGLGFLVGIALIVAGNLFHRRQMEVFAQGLVGTGISILYLCTYAVFKYDYVSQPVALLMMSVVTAAAVIQSIRNDSLAVSLIGLVGGFLTPLLLSNGATDASGSIGLFVYITLLDIGLLAVVIKKDSWAAIEPLALGATYLTYLVWRVSSYEPGYISFTIPFLTIFWALFFAMDIYRVVKSIRTYPELRMGLATVNTIFFYIALYVDIFGEHPNRMAAVTLMLGVVYFLSVFVLMRRRIDNLSVVSRYMLSSVILLVIATGLQFRDSGFTMATLWSVEALLLVWLGLTSNMKVVWMPGLCLFAPAVIAIIAQPNAFTHQDSISFVPIANIRFLAYAVLAAAIGVSAYLFGKSEDEKLRDLSPQLHFGWFIIIFALIGLETNDYFLKLMAMNPEGTLGVYYYTARYLMMSALWLLYSIPLMFYGVRKQATLFTGLGTVALAAGVGFAAVQSSTFRPIENFHLLFNIRAGILVLAIAVIMLAEKLAERHPSLWLPKMPNVLVFAASVIGFELLTVETLDYFHRAAPVIGYPQTGAHMVRNLVLACVWLLYSVFLAWYGARKNSSLTVLSGIGALTLGLMTVVIQGFRYVPLDSFVLLFNLRAAAFLLTILVLAAYRHWIAVKLSAYEALEPIFAAIPVISSLLIFELISVETWDYFSKSITFTGQWHNAASLRQMALSVVWLVYSIILVGYGMWRRYLPVRLVAMGLFMITILKVFLSDLSFLDTLYRIFSFLGLGLILLATSYLYQRYRSVILDTDAAETSETI